MRWKSARTCAGLGSPAGAAAAIPRGSASPASPSDDAPSAARPSSPLRVSPPRPMASPIDVPSRTSMILRRMDWGAGRYEHIAGQLLPAARALVDRAAPTAGERVVDVGCGSGSAALLAAERGSEVLGIDPAPRLLEVARAEAAARGLVATFAQGDAASIALPDGAADLVLSNFGAIFAPDAQAAAAEMARVAAPGGRIALTAWIPGGTVSAAVRIARQASAPPAGGAPFAWHDRDALAGLLGPHGFEVAVHEQPIAFIAASPAAYLEDELANHPLWVAGRDRLGPVRAKILAVLEDGNEDPAAFRATSRYVIATATRA